MWGISLGIKIISISSASWDHLRTSHNNIFKAWVTQDWILSQVVILMGAKVYKDIQD